MVLINGEKTSADGMTVKACIDERGYNPLALCRGWLIWFRQRKKCSRRLSSATEKSFKRNSRARLLLYADWEDWAQIFL